MEVSCQLHRLTSYRRRAQRWTCSLGFDRRVARVAKVPVPHIRSAISHGPRGLEVVVPARRHPLVMAFLTVWLVGWLLEEVSVAAELLTAGATIFHVTWLAMWTVGGALCIGVLLWMTTGKERITIGRGVLAHRYELFGLGRSRDYDLTHVQHFAVSAASMSIWDMGAGLRPYGLGGGPISFDYGAKTIRMAAGVDDAEGRVIVDRIHDYLGLPE